jgi:hypothetical protein
MGYIAFFVLYISLMYQPLIISIMAAKNKTQRQKKKNATPRLVGYARVSTDEQDVALQFEACNSTAAIGSGFLWIPPSANFYNHDYLWRRKNIFTRAQKHRHSQLTLSANSRGRRAHFKCERTHIEVRTTQKHPSRLTLGANGYRRW